MNSLQAGYRNEIRLMLYRKKTVYFLAFSLLLPIVFAVLFRRLEPVLAFAAISSSFPVQSLGFYTSLWIPLFIFLAVADLFPRETSVRTMKLMLLRPITRFRAYLAKMLALGSAIAAIMILQAVATVLCNALAGSKTASGFDFVHGFEAYAAGFFSMWAFAALFVFLSQWFQSATGFLAFSIILYAGAKILPFFLKGFSAFSLTSYTDWFVLWLSGAISPVKLVASTLFVLSGLVLFTALGFLKFDRKDA